jgi:hypothetical protein
MTLSVEQELWTIKTIGKGGQISSFSRTVLVFCLCSKVADLGDIAIQKQHLTTFGTRAKVCATPLSVHLHRNQIHLGAHRLTRELQCTSQQSV